MDTGKPKRIVILGAGMSGLVAAFEILERARKRGLGPPPEVVVLEASPRPGGNVRTERDPAAGFLCEWGPEGFLDNVPETLDLARRIGREGRLVRADPRANKRYILRGGRLRLVPTAPPAFLFSDVLPFRQRLRVFGEPFAGAPRDPERDETVFEFASRRIGRGAASILVDAMVSGVYAGDSRCLSLRAAFPKMHRMEREYGSLVKAMIARMKERKKTRAKSGGPAGPGGTITSAVDGMEEFVEGLVAAVGESRIRFNTPVAEIVRGNAGARVHPNTRAHADGPAAGSTGSSASQTRPRTRASVVLVSGERIEADAVVVTIPSWAAAPLFHRSNPSLSRPLDDIPVASIAVVVTGHRRKDVEHPLDGFGFLIPRGEGRRTLGTLWPASTFPGRAPEGHVLLRSMIGGATDPDAVKLDDKALLDLADREVNSVLGVRGAPVWSRIFRFPRGIPQYTVGHMERLAKIEKALDTWDNLYLAGTSYYGIAINSTCERAPALADAVLEAMEPRREGQARSSESAPASGERKRVF